VITCPKCSKDNQDHYKFCLGCGAELPRDAAPKPFAPQTPPQGMKARASAGPPPAAAAAAAPAPAAAAAAPAPASRAAAPAAAPAAAAGTVVCPQCGHVNSPAHVFCGSCGFRLGGAQASRAPAPAPVESPPAAGGGSVSLTALRADGSEAGTYALPSPTTTIGRETGGIFAGDSYLSPRHATIRFAGTGRAMVKDEGSLNGVYKKLGRDVPVELRTSDVFRIGQEIIRFEALTPQPASPDGVERLGAPAKGYIGRIALIIGREETGNAFPIPESGVHLGRERGDILFPEDGYVSGLHCRLSYEGGRLMLTDLGSSNGTFIRIREETEVRTGDVLLMGQQLFRVTV
jgi:pSer/pThr/pTyr-binding forkhead associated (FHA) protein